MSMLSAEEWDHLLSQWDQSLDHMIGSLPMCWYPQTGDWKRLQRIRDILQELKERRDETYIPNAG